MNTALVIIDIQRDYFPGGAMELAGSEAAGRQAGRLLAAFRDKAMPVIHVEHVSVRPGASFFVPGTRGVEIHDCVAPGPFETVITKHFPNAFRETGLRETLDDLGTSRLVIAGMMTHMCVDTTVRAATDMGFECLLAHDACATRTLAFDGVTVPAEQVHAAFLAALNGLFARIGTTDDLLAAL